MKAIDLYSGVGGWALGFKLAGISVVGSYEWSPAATETEKRNLRINATCVDIRTIPLKAFTKDVDIVVGSPPCTQFSFSNRGGNGNLAEGLVDITKFFAIIEHVRPTFWAMENVPRVAKILQTQFATGGNLHHFRWVRKNLQIQVLDMSDFGLPQRRKRCLAGNFDFKVLNSYMDVCRRISVADVLKGLNGTPAKDLNFGVSVDRALLTDNEREPPLDDEEARINRESKERHPVYNGMRFPEPVAYPIRTVTATCTRVSRESLIVENVGQPGTYRRLTIRERGAFQGFPLTFQFYGSTYSQKMQLVGNAMPPAFAYYLANAMLGTPAGALVTTQKLRYRHTTPRKQVASTRTDQIGRRYPRTRRFRMSIPNLHFKSGTRFDFVNRFSSKGVYWRVEFLFGTPQDIRRLVLDSTLLSALRRYRSVRKLETHLVPHIDAADLLFQNATAQNLQDRWTNKDSDGVHPFELIDYIGGVAAKARSKCRASDDEESWRIVSKITRAQFSGQPPVGEQKLQRCATSILIGMLTGAIINSRISR